MVEPGPLAHQRLVPRRAQLVAATGGAAVLPDQRPVDRLAALGVPGDDGLALVGDPDRVQLGPLDPGVGDRLPATRRVTSQISFASCSTQPGRGKSCWNSE